MQTNERNATLSLSAIMAFRMLGMFMVLPVLSLYAGKLPGATPILVGFALGVYGLTQACLQIPFGALSDKIGRKPIITAGLILFAAGSLFAAMSHSITGIIIGRALQGAGAIGSTILATISDITKDEDRSKAMALIGMSIGFSFAIAMILGPMINAWLALSGIFWATFAFALIGIVLLHTVVPTPPRLVTSSTVRPSLRRISAVFHNTQLLRLNLGIFCMHAIMTATFIAIPVLLLHFMHVSQTEQTAIYLTVLILSFFIMIPFIIIAEKKRKMKAVFLGAIGTLIASQLLLTIFHTSIASITLTLLLFFTAFTLLEASLPSLVSKIAPIEFKGTAMGVYSTSQFLGIFIGGSMGGIIFSHYYLSGIFLFCSILGCIWLFFAASMKQPPYLSTFLFSIDELKPDMLEQLRRQLLNSTAIAEVAIIQSEKTIYIKADKKNITKEQLRNLINQGNLP